MNIDAKMFNYLLIKVVNLIKSHTDEVLRLKYIHIGYLLNDEFIENFTKVQIRSKTIQFH